MACTCDNTPCSGLPSCTCPVKDLKTDCSVYNGPTLGCSGIASGTILTSVIEQLDAFICNKFNEVINYLTLINIGGAAEVYKGISGIGNKEIRTLQSGDLNLIDVVQDTDTINFTPGTPSLILDSGTDILSLIVTTLSGSTTFSTIDLSEFNYDTFVQSAFFDSGTQVLTIVRNNGEADIIVDLGFLDNHVESGTYDSNTITLTLKDATTVDIDLSTLLTEIASAQVQSDFTNTTPGDKAFILNKNPEKTVVLGVAGTYNVVDADNNYIIEIDNGANDVTIDFTSVTETSNFFVGFVQKGIGVVTFTGADIIPLDTTNKMYGQGKNAALSIINSTKYLQGQLKFA
jgi:hypothetical protein